MKFCFVSRFLFGIYLGLLIGRKVKFPEIEPEVTLFLVNKEEPLSRELCDIWNWSEKDFEKQMCQGVERLDSIPKYTVGLNWP